MSRPPGPCDVCGKDPAPFQLGWPGFRRDQPPAIRGKRLRLCAFDGPCHAAAIKRAEAKAGAVWPGRASPRNPSPPAPEAETDQPSLI